MLLLVAREDRGDVPDAVGTALAAELPDGQLPPDEVVLILHVFAVICLMCLCACHDVYVLCVCCLLFNHISCLLVIV